MALFGPAASQNRAINPLYVCHSTECHAHLKLATEDVKGSTDARLAIGRQGIEKGFPDEAGAGTARHRLEHVLPRLHTAIEQQLTAICYGLGDLRQDRNG